MPKAPNKSGPERAGASKDRHDQAPKAPSQAAKTREERLAEALRANLRRRKGRPEGNDKDT